MQRLRSRVYNILYTSYGILSIWLWFAELWPNLGQTNETIACGSVSYKEIPVIIMTQLGNRFGFFCLFAKSSKSKILFHPYNLVFSLSFRWLNPTDVINTFHLFLWSVWFQWKLRLLSWKVYVALRTWSTSSLFHSIWWHSWFFLIGYFKHFFLSQHIELRFRKINVSWKKVEISNWFSTNAD